MSDPRTIFRRAGIAIAGAGTAAVLTVMVLNLIMAWVTKAGCVSHHDGHIPTSCYSDIQKLWGDRGLGHHYFPYITGRYIKLGNIVGIGHGELEYPVLTGLFAWAASLGAHNSGQFLILNATLLAPLGLICAWLLARMAGPRALYFAAAPSIAFYTFLNWDILAVAITLAGIYAWWHKHPYLAAAAFAAGGCAKLWPAALLLPLAFDLYAQSDRRQAIRALTLGAGTGIAINLPFMIANWRGWYAPFAFQSVRAVDSSTNSMWYWSAHSLSVGVVTDLSWAVTLAGFALVLAASWKRFKTTGTYPFVQTCGALVIVFVLAAKTFSPQYALWLIPFFALTQVRWYLWAVFIAADALLYACWFPEPTNGPWLWVAVFIRAGVLALTIPAMLRAPAGRPDTRATATSA